MKRKVLSAILAAAMVFGLAACGNNASAPANTAAADTATTDTAAVDNADASNPGTGESAPEWSGYDALIDEIRTTTDFAKRADLMHQAEDMLMDTWAVIPIYYYNDVYMCKPEVKGFYATVFGNKYFMYTTKDGADVLKINLASEPDYHDPALNSSVDGACLIVNSFTGLYTYDANGKVIPALAQDMPEISEDGCTYTIKMIESKWSNGEELNANDFIYSWNRFGAEETAADYAYLLDVVARNDDGSFAFQALDDYTIEIKLNSPCPYFTDLLAFPTFYPVYQPEVEAANTDGTVPGKWCQEAGFTSNGAYTLESWSHNESMVYKANPYFYDAANVTMPELNYMLSADDTAIFAAYNSGDLDFIDTVPNDEIPNLLDNPEFGILDQLGTYYIGFNVNDGMFDGMTVEQAAAFRHAVCLLIDRQWICENVGQTGQQPADSFVPAGMADGNGGIFKTADVSYYDAASTGADMVDEAVALMEEAGFTMTDNGDGTYSCDPVVSIVYLTNTTSGHVAIAESIQQDLAIVGIEITIQQQDWNVFLENRKEGNFTLAREGWVADFNDPINMLELFTTESGNNDMQFGK